MVEDEYKSAVLRDIAHALQYLHSLRRRDRVFGA